MKLEYRVEGLKQIENDLSRSLMKIRGKTKAGLVAAGMIVKREAQKITPMRYGNLVNSAFVVTDKSIESSGIDGQDFVDGDRVGLAAKLNARHSEVMTETMAKIKAYSRAGDPVVAVGYSAYYAPYVHEIPAVHYTKPGTGPKFLERAIREHKEEIIKAVKSRVKRAV